MAMHPSVAQHLEEIRDVSERYGIEKLEIFGSAMTPDFDVDKSDVDFIVHYPPGYDFGYFAKRLFDLEEEISTILGRPAQLVMTSALKKERFSKNADKTRTVIYVASESDRATGRHSDSQPVHPG